MVKKLFYAFMAILFICAFTITTTPVYAQEEEEEVVEDVADISLEDLLNVEITTAGRRAEKIGEIPASVVVVTRKDIETYGYQTLAEVLQSIPGLYLTDDYYSKKFGIRGSWTERDNGNVIILVNDIPMRDDLYNAYPLENTDVPVEAIDRIEVVRGPMSVIYGSGAFFGVINIKTRLEGQEPLSLIAAGAGSEKAYKLFARASGQSGDFEYAFNGSYYENAGINNPFGEMVDTAVLPYFGVPEDATTEEHLGYGVKYFNFSGSFKNFYFASIYSENKQQQIFLLPYTLPTDRVNRATRVLFGYKANISEKVRADAKFIYFQNRWKYDYNWLFEGLWAVQDDSTSAYMAELDLFFDPSPKVSITMGVNYHKVLDVFSSINVPLLGLGNYILSLDDGNYMINQSIFAQFNLNLSKYFKLVAGARVEQMPKYDMKRSIGAPEGDTTALNYATYDQSDPQFIPRVALLISPNENNVFKVLYGKAITRPSFFQSTDLVTGVASESLLPETIQTFELNYIGTWSPKFSVSMSVFYNLLENLIYRTQLLVQGEYVTYHANIGELRTTGAELSITARPSEKFFLELSGTYQSTKDKRPGFEDIEPGYSPKLLGYLKASAFLTDDISLAVTGNYVDKMQTYWDISTGGRIGEEVDSYFILDANLRIRKLFGTGLFLNIRGSNLLNQEIRYPTTSNNDWATYGYPGKGASFLVTLGYKFIPIPMPMP